MDEISSPVTAGSERQQSLLHSRRYVIFQLVGWSFFFFRTFISYLTVYAILRPTDFRKAHPVEFVLLNCVVPPLLGILISHFTLCLVRTRNWKNLTWSAFVPRLLGVSIVQAAILTMWFLLVFRQLFNAPRLPPGFAAWFRNTFSLWWQGFDLFVAWWGLYFLYHLFDRVARAETDKLQLVLRAKDAELLALKTQINPHFIFNFLNSLRALVDEQPARARSAVTQFANLLRYSLRSTQLELVPFEEELQTTTDYLTLEQIRHENRLHLRVDVRPETLKVGVPPMLLQTIVENAVKYGIDYSKGRCEVSVTAHCADGRMHIRVTNPGKILKEPNSVRESTGLGLRNATARLDLLFPAQANLQLKDDGCGLIIADVLFPAALVPKATR